VKFAFVLVMFDTLAQVLMLDKRRWSTATWMSRRQFRVSLKAAMGNCLKRSGGRFRTHRLIERLRWRGKGNPVYWMT
jgi:hypothetical protein